MRRLALLLVAVAASGCGIITFGGGGGTTLDAHVVYRLRPGCGTLLARTLDHGYSVLTPLDATRPFEATGIFEGPAREGESVFRYTPPNVTPVWTERAAAVGVDVVAVGLGLEDARVLWASACGVPAGADGPADPDVLRLPASAPPAP